MGGGLVAVNYERNTVHELDALEFCRGLADESVDVVWTSPPYNLEDEFRGGGGRAAGEFQYAGGDGKRGDGLTKPEPVYQQEQVRVLTQLARALRGDGVLFYSHKVRLKGGVAISPLEWLRLTDLSVIQELVWDRGGSANVDDRRFLPVSERIYVLAKSPGLRLVNKQYLPDVLRIPPTHHKRKESGHPCPTPPAVVRACLSVVEPARLRRLLCVDPYAGTGTTGVIAREMGWDYVLNDWAYKALAEKNLATPTTLPLEVA